MRFFLYLLLFLSLCFTSCATRDQVVYFQEPEDLIGYVNTMDYEPTIQKNDLLNIDVVSRNEELVAPFKKNSEGQNNSQNDPLSGYLVNSEGSIQFPILGKMNVIGKTRSELEIYIQDQLRTMVTDVVVTVRIMNFRITVLGETGASRIDVEDGRMTIPELFASVGDISYDGNRENIVVIREVDNVKSVGRIDMTSSDVFKNPFYYLKQNDIVYVEPRYRKIKSAGIINSYAGIFSLIGSVTGLIFLFSSL